MGIWWIPHFHVIQGNSVTTVVPCNVVFNQYLILKLCSKKCPCLRHCKVSNINVFLNVVQNLTGWFAFAVHLLRYFPIFEWDNYWDVLASSLAFLMFITCHDCFQIALVQHSIQKEQCNAPTVGKLRKVNGFMQVVAIQYLSLTWTTGPMTRICMI